MNKIIDGKWVVRFSKPIIVAHWVHAIAFIVLAATGLPIFLGIPLPAGIDTKLLHRIFGIAFIIPTFFILIVDRKSFTHWIGGILKWGKHDAQFFTEFPKEFFGMHAEVPKQDFYNAGQKLNSILVIFFSTIMIVSGVIIWLKSYFSAGLIVWMLPLHAVGAALLVSTILGHAYLSVGHPASRPSIRGMIKGSIDLDYAKAHHGRWYDEVTKNKD